MKYLILFHQASGSKMYFSMLLENTIEVSCRVNMAHRFDSFASAGRTLAQLADEQLSNVVKVEILPTH